MIARAHQIVMDEDLHRLLADVARAGFFYEALSPPPSRIRQLRDLESLGYIQYCSYPEEFWVALPAGEDFLSKSRPA
jgi:hypothetical protein